LYAAYSILTDVQWNSSDAHYFNIRDEFPIAAAAAAAELLPECGSNFQILK